MSDLFFGLLDYLGKDLAYPILLFAMGIVLFVLVGLGGLNNRDLSKPFRWILGIISVILIILSVMVFRRNFFLEKDLTTSDNNTSTDVPIDPSLTNQNYYSAALFVKTSFDQINNAGNLLDVSALMPKTFSENLQRNADFWWSVMVEYEIYGCRENIIDINLRYFNRSDIFHNKEPNTSFSRYTLNLVKNKWIIDDSVEIDGSSCPLVFSNFTID